MHEHAVGLGLDVADRQSGELGAPQRPGESDQQDGPVAHSDQRIGHVLKHRPDCAGGRRGPHDRGNADAAPDSRAAPRAPLRTRSGRPPP
jgi:hypothetical protein